MDRHGTIRSSAGSSVAAPLSGFRQPPSAEPSVAGAALPVHLSLLSRFGGHQQCRRTGLAPTGGGAQELGRKSHGERSAGPSRTHQHPANGSTAREEAAGGADRLIGGEGPGQDPGPGATYPRNPAGFLACSSSSESTVENRVCPSAGVDGALGCAAGGGR